MGITSTLRGLDARLSRYALENLKSGIGYPNPGWSPPAGFVTSSTGAVINEDKANTVAAWFAGIRVISEDIAVAPLHVYERRGRENVKAEDNPLYRLLHDQPNPEMTSFTFRSVLQSHALSWGNGYAEKELNGSGRVIGLWPLRPDRMEVVWDEGRRVYLYRRDPFSDPVRLSADRVFHLPGLGFDGLVGYSILRLARETLSAAINLRDYGNRVVNNDARPGVVMTHPSTLSSTARQNIQDSWNEANRRDGPGRTALLEEDIKITTLGFPPEDVQFLESQKWQVSEVARWLRLSPHKIGDLERATFSNIEESNIDHVTSTLRAWFVRWEQQLNKDVLMDPSLYCEHNMDAALRGKTLERADAWVKKIGIGAATPNEWRESDNQNPVPWGDERVATPNNTAPTPAPEPTPAKAAEPVVVIVDAPQTKAMEPPTIIVDAPITVDPVTVKADLHIDSVAVSEAALDIVGGRVIAANKAASDALVAELRGNTEALSTAVAAVGGAVRAEVRGTEAKRADEAAAAAAQPVRRSFERDSAGRISAYIEESGGVTKRTTILRDASGQLAGTVTG